MILLARHGETDDNREPLRFQGWRDTPMNDVGRRQAAELAEQLAGDGIERLAPGARTMRPEFHMLNRGRKVGPPGGGITSLWSSDLSRARETAEIVGERLGLQPRLDWRLREGDRGDWEGRLFEDVAREEPERFAAWKRAGATWRFPGGESLAEHQQRVAASVEDARRARELPALLVCHGGSIRVMLCLSDPRGLDAFHEFKVPNASVVEV